MLKSIRTRGLFIGFGVFAAILVVYLVVSQLQSATQSATPQTQPVSQVETGNGNVTQNSEGRDVYVISKGVNTQSLPISNGSGGGFLNRFIDGVEASNKTAMLVRFALIAGIIAMVLGKGFIGLYSHKRKTYEDIKEDINTNQEVILKLEALISRTKDEERKQRYENQLKEANERFDYLQELQRKNDKKFLR